jgi:sugar (pentulose or hexulose) kinase
VTCGIHDSNASLLPHLLARRPPFSVVSTGTWVIALSVGGRPVALDPARDTLLNVNALGDPVASARFMGGREHDLVMAGRPARATPRDCAAVLAGGIMLLPAVEPRSGPFQNRTARWSHPEADLTDGERHAALSYYLALMTAECLSVTGADGPVLVEGPFNRNAAYLDMLAAATGRPVSASASATGTSIGAALLHDMRRTAEDLSAAARAPQPDLQGYARRWRESV